MRVGADTPRSRRASRRKALAASALAIFSLWALAAGARAADDGFHLFAEPAQAFPVSALAAGSFSSAAAASDWSGAAGAVLAAEGEPAAKLQKDKEKETSSAPRKTRATLITVGVLAGNIASTLSGPINKGFVPFHTTQENWFGKDTYAGGADKASHFVLYNILSRELHIAYYRSGYADPAAFWMAFATTVGAGMITEIGDSLGHGGGGSYEDVLADSLGAAAAVFVTRHGLDDVWGFRFGLVPNRVPEPCCPVTFPGKDYSEEIYTGDLKLAGFAKRLCRDIGVARFLLLSVTYGTKGYRNSLIPYRQQQIGIEVGVNFPQILTELGVRDTTWWGRCLFLFFNAFRVPFTQIGMRYDFIHHAWHGPNIGEEYDPGPGR
jgi:hypothetical protein